jgi:hypothetical protein
MSDANSKPENTGDSVKSAWEGLTRKAFYATVWVHGMKTTTKQRLKAAALAVLAIAALLLLGWLETQAGLPNH